jgi:hypothetical protein
VKGSWNKLHDEELHNLYSSSNIIKVIKLRSIKWVGYAARMGEMRNAFKLLVGKYEGKRPLRKPTRRWENKIRMDLRVEICGLDSSDSGQGLAVGSVNTLKLTIGFHKMR